MDMLRIAIWTLLLNTCTEVLGTDPLYCLNCQHVTSPKHCHSVAVCRNGEACFMEKYVNSAGEILFNLGCHGNQICNNSISEMPDHRGKRQNIISSHSSSSTCLYCCKGNLCNSKGCGDDGYPTTRGPICFNCPQSTDPQKCDLIQVCDRNEKCLIDAVVEFGEIVFSSKCTPTECYPNEAGQVFGKRELFKRSQRRTCRSCCSTDLCNNKCNNVNITPQTQMTHTTVPYSSRSSSTPSPKEGNNVNITPQTQMTHTTVPYSSRSSSTPSPKEGGGHTGKEYIISFPESTSNLTQAQVMITTMIDTVVYIESPHPGVNRTVNVTAASGVTISLPPSLMLRGNAIEQKGVRISTPVNIAVYVMTQYGNKGEAYAAIPVEKLADLYYGAAYHNSFISIVALNDNTHIRINVGHRTQTYNDRNYTTGDTITIYLSRLSTFQIKGNPYLFNTKITSDKPIGVISGSTSGDMYGSYRYRNQQLEYIPPVKSLGNRFVVPPFQRTDYSTVEVFEDRESSYLNFASKNTNMSYSIVGDMFFRDFFYRPWIIESDKPLVVIFTFDRDNTSSYLCPAKIIIPSLSQFSNDYKYITPGTNRFEHFIAIIIKADYVGGLRVDNRTIYSMNPDLQAIIAENSLYNIITLTVDSGQHTAHHLDPDVRFGMIVYGFASTQTYGFPVGLNL